MTLLRAKHSNDSRKRLGLALSGGGARGFAHVGILKVLEQEGIFPGFIAGTSMGGIIGGAYACGVPVAEIEARCVRLSSMRELVKLIDLSPQRRGLLRGDRVRDFLADFFIERQFDSLPIPLALPAVDLLSAREVVLKSGLVFPAVMATSAVPGLFEPVDLGPYRLVDGGVLNNLPVDRARELGDGPVIAVDVQFDPYSELPWNDLPVPARFPVPLPPFFLEFYRAEIIMIAEITRAHLLACPPDLLIRPPIAPDIDVFLGFNRIPEIIAAGEQAAREALPAITKLLR